MVLYNCEKCGKSFNLKGDLKRHNERKKSCVNSKNIDKKIVINNENKTVKSIDLTNDFNLTNNLNLAFIENIKEQIQNNDENILCNILDQLKHFNEQFCELNKKIETLEESNIELTKSNTILTKSNTELTKSNDEIKNKLLALIPTTTQINVTNNVTINITPFGKENLNFITEEKCIKELIYSGFGCIQKYIDIVHFNKDKPEYHNMYIPNRKDLNQILINDGEKWNIAITEDIIEKLLDKMIFFNRSNVEKYNNEGKLQETKIKGINRLFDKYDEDVNKLVKENSKDIKNNIYNNRNIVMSTNKIKK
jgi:hypothetical protein